MSLAPGNGTTNYNISAGNRYGPIIDITAGGTPAINGSSAADTTTTNHPWQIFPTNMFGNLFNSRSRSRVQR